MNRKAMTMSLATIALTTILFVPGSAVAETRGSPATVNREITEQLKDFKYAASQMRTEADTLWSFARTKQLSQQSHSARHVVLKEHINRMGETLAQLEAQKSEATDLERMAIEHARPHLAAAADHLTDAMNLVQENSKNVLFQNYSESAEGLSAHANELYDKLDTILDYNDAKVRMDDLVS